jgi:sugar-specific transcriptional regulator TrmB
LFSTSYYTNVITNCYDRLSQAKQKVMKIMAKEVELSVKEQAEQILRCLGLNHSQAKLYIALAMCHDSANVNTIGSFTNLARTEVYRLLAELHDIGLVEKTIRNPLTFKAISLDEAISILMEERRKKLDLLAKETEKLLTRLPKETETIEVQNNQEFVLIPRGKPLAHRIEKAIQASNDKILVITPWRILTQWMLNTRDLWQKALQKGVEVCWIMERTPNMDYNLKIANDIPTNSNFKLRATSDSIDTRIGIYDNAEVFIGTNKTQDVAGSPAIWTNNSTLVKVLSDFFYSKWRQAKE